MVAATPQASRSILLCDAHALFISETCKMTNIPIPEEIALLGVDNDELMCNISDPPISP